MCGTDLNLSENIPFQGGSKLVPEQLWFLIQNLPNWSRLGDLGPKLQRNPLTRERQMVSPAFHLVPWSHGSVCGRCASRKARGGSKPFSYEQYWLEGKHSQLFKKVNCYYHPRYSLEKVFVFVFFVFCWWQEKQNFHSQLSLWDKNQSLGFQLSQV